MIPSSTEHDLQWQDRLLDWLDGDLDASQAAAFAAHHASCELCRQQVQALDRLDASLRAAVPPVTLSAAFDRQLFARIDAVDETKRAAARQRAEQELQENLRSLSRSWRRTLGMVIPGVIAGIALAFALRSWLYDIGVTHALIAEGAHNLGRDVSTTVQLVLTATIGAGVGLVVARWLASVTD